MISLDLVCGRNRQRMKLIDAGNAAHHVLESRLIGFVVGNIVNRRGTTGPLLSPSCQILDGDFFRIADIDDFPDGTLQRHQP